MCEVGQVLLLLEVLSVSGFDHFKHRPFVRLI